MSHWRDAHALIPNKTRIIIIYPTENPEVVIVPIVSSIIVFPIVAFIVLCCLRRRAAAARQKAREARRGDLANEKSGQSINRLSPLSGGPSSSGYGNPMASSSRRITHSVDIEMTTTTLEIVTPDS